jgi:hypothetical protein
MIRQLTTCAAVSALLLSGCATRANSVPPVSIAAADYRGLSCEDSRGQLVIARAKVNALSRRQNTAAVADAAAVFLFLVPLGSVFGADVAGELGEAKGEALALERHIATSCSGGERVAAAPETATVASASYTPATPAQPAIPAKPACGMVPQRDGSVKLVQCR